MRVAKTITIKSYIIALLIVIVGIVLSVELNDWGWFSRSGALLVVNGIVLTSRQIFEHMQQLKQLQFDYQCNSQRDWASRDKRGMFSDSKEIVWRNEKYGLYMLIAGTLIWGFGDLTNLL